jgi:molybdenum cofactor synthesis domain-containing protein
MIKTAILTVSDSCSNKERQDISGQTIADILTENGFEISTQQIVPDDVDAISTELIKLSHEVDVEIVFTTGGTGLGPRDVTPEATIAVCDRLVPGLGELMRLKGLEYTPNAILSRSTAGIRNNTLIINLPGSPKAVRQCLEVILNILPHAVDMMRGHGH